MKIRDLKKEYKNIKGFEHIFFHALTEDLSNFEKTLVKKASGFKDLKKSCRDNYSKLNFLKTLFSEDENAYRGLSVSDVQLLCSVNSDSGGGGGVVVKLGDFSILIKNGYGDRETSCYLITRDANACHYMSYESYFEIGEGASISKKDSFEQDPEPAVELPAGRYQSYSFCGNVYFLKVEQY